MDNTYVKAYNRENGIMWICYSAVFWISMVMGIWNVSTAGIVDVEDLLNERE